MDIYDILRRSSEILGYGQQLRSKLANRRNYSTMKARCAHCPDDSIPAVAKAIEKRRRKALRLQHTPMLRA
jgi:hypothetical protein